MEDGTESPVRWKGVRKKLLKMVLEPRTDCIFIIEYLCIGYDGSARKSAGVSI
jgi:hypothetical protein